MRLYEMSAEFAALFDGLDSISAWEPTIVDGIAVDENGEVIFPDPPKTKTQKAINSWQERCKVLRTNNSKWTAARKWCNANGYIFKVISEEEIGINY